MADPMKIRATLQGDIVEVRVIMAHDMETGQRKDGTGRIIPPHFIQTVQVTFGTKTIFSAQWGTGIARNPFLMFRFRGATKGDRIRITWTDNRGDRRADEAVIA